MPSSTSLYSSTPGNANVASQNFTTLYSGSGTINPQQAYGNANVVSLLATSTDGGNTIGNISATGNVTADYFIGTFQGNITGNINVTGANTEVLFNNAGNVGTAAGFTFVNTTGNLAVPGNVSAVGNVTGTYILGNGSQLTGLPATYSNANVTSLLASFGSNVVSTTGNVTAGYFIGNGSQLTGLAATYSNANVVSLLAAFGSNTISTTGNVTAGYFVGNGSALTSIAGANVTGTVANATYALNANASTFAGTVTTNAQPNITSVGILTAINTSGNVSATGNITGNYFFGNGSQLTGLPATYGNANVAANLAAFATNPISTSGNITAGYFFGNGSGLTDINAANIVGAYGNANVAANLAAFATNPISTSGNITAGYFIGNGAALTSLTGANVTGVVANATYALNANAATYATNAIQANVANVANSVAGANVTGTVANATYALNANASTFAGTVTDAAQPNITSVGILTAINTSGAISATGNITGNVFTGNGSGLTDINAANIVGAYGNANVANFLGNGFGSNTIVTTGNITTGNLLTGGVVSATGNVSAGNVIVPLGGRYYGDFTSGTTAGRTAFQTTATGTSSATSLTAIPGANHITSNTAFSSQINLFANGADVGNSAFGRMQMFGNRLNFEATAAGTGTVGNMRFAAGSAQIVLLNTGNVGIGNADPQHTLSVSAALYVGTDLSVNGNISPVLSITASGNISGGNVITGGLIFATGNVTGGNLLTGGLISATGNINGANLVATANLTSTQQTVVGTANTGTTGNIVMSGRNLATDMAFNPDGATGNALYTGRVMVGTGWAGNISVGQPSRLSTMDMMNRGNTSASVRQFESDSIVNLTANVTNTSFRQQAFGARLRVGGGSAANTTAFGGIVAAPFTVAVGQFNLDIGNASPYFLGNTSISHAALNSGALALSAGSSIGNAYGYVPFINSAGTGGTSNITNYIGMATSFAGANVTGNLFCFYNGNTTSLSAYSIQQTNNARAAANYYFLRNDDAVAQVQLGSLRSYNEFQYSTATTGTVNIDKLNAQVQFLNPTANVTIGDLQNFVTTASDSVNNDNQTDTVTLIIQQGATPYTVTMPTGNAAIKYAGGISTIGATANAVTMVSITAFRSSANAAVYLATVSPEFS